MILAFAKKIMGKMLSGKFNFTSMQRPAIITNPESHLEVIAYEFIIII